MLPAKFHLSKSSFMQYRQCPYIFKRKYIDKFPFEPSPAQKLGTFMHSQIEAFYKTTKDKGYFSIEGMDTKAAKYLMNFLRTEKARYDRLQRIGKIKYFHPFTEQRIKFPAERLSGIADLLFPLANGGYRLAEIKTGKYRPQWADSVRLELEFYAYVFEQALKINIPLLSVNFVKDSIQHYWPANGDIKPKIDKVWSGIKAEEFDPKKNMWCGYCDLKFECPLMNKGNLKGFV